MLARLAQGEVAEETQDEVIVQLCILHHDETRLQAAFCEVISVKAVVQRVQLVFARRAHEPY